MRIQEKKRKMVDGKLILYHEEGDFGDGWYVDVDGSCYKIYIEKDHWICDGCGRNFHESRARRYWCANPNRSYCTRCVRIVSVTELIHGYITEMKAARKGN